jgi:hypothetical protein
MSHYPTEEMYRRKPSKIPFRLVTLIVVVADIAVLVALARSLGKDGLFIGSIGVPLVTGFVLFRGSIGRKLVLSVAVTLIVHGISWCVFSPDAKFWQMPYRGDDVVGVSLSLGLITTGVIILAFRVLALRGQSLAIGCLSVALVYSTLLNVGMVSAYFNVTNYLVEQLERQGQLTKTRTPVLLGDESLVAMEKPLSD